MIRFTPLHESFVAEVSGIDLHPELSPAQVHALEAGIAAHSVLVFRDQLLNDEELARFGTKFGEMHRSITLVDAENRRRLPSELLSDISNVDKDGTSLSPQDRRRIQQRANLLWHTDNSFRKPASSYTILAARIVPAEAGETEFADTRAAFAALPAAMQQHIAGLRVRHSLAHSRILAGTPELNAVEARHFPPTEQPLVRIHPISGLPALFVGSHAESIVGRDDAASRALLDELNAFAVQPRFVFRHRWRRGDIVMWDNRSTLHRALAFDEMKYQRDLRRCSIAEQTAAMAA